ncbi:MAG: hypothetical protein R2824_05370 [Saprospiraceae bacterium]
MNIKSYIEKLDFDKYQLFYRENKNFETTFLDIGEKSLLINVKDGKQLDNEILIEGYFNPTYKLAEEKFDEDYIKKLVAKETTNYFPNRKKAIYDSAIVFYNQGKIVEHLNISLKEKICRSRNDLPIDLSLEFVDKIAARLKELGSNPFKNYLPPSLAIMEQWRHYKFPFEFYKNPVFDVFEATISSGLFAINWKHAKIKITPKSGRIEIGQLNKAKYIEENRGITRGVLLDKFWDEYNKWKFDYELPELSNKEQLYQLVELSSIRIENDEKFSTQLYFRTWDEEHGQYVRYLDKDKIEFE